MQWPDTSEKHLESAQVGPGTSGLPVILPGVFGAAKPQFARVNEVQPLTLVGHSKVVFDTGRRMFSSDQDSAALRFQSASQFEQFSMPKSIPKSQAEALLMMQRDAGFVESRAVRECDEGQRLSAGVLEDNTGTDCVNRWYLAHGDDMTLKFDELRPANADLDPLDAPSTSHFNDAIHSPHRCDSYQFESGIRQITFDYECSWERLATRLLVRTRKCTYVFFVKGSKNPVTKNLALLLSTPYGDARGDRHVNCDILGTKYAAITADGTWRVYDLDTVLPNPPIVAQHYTEEMEHVSDWKGVLLTEGDRVLVANRQVVRLYNPWPSTQTPPYSVLLSQYEYSETVCDLKRSPGFPHLALVLTNRRLSIFDVRKPQVPALTWRHDFHHQDVSLQLSVSVVAGVSVAIIHSQLSSDKVIHHYLYYPDKDPDYFLTSVCDPYTIPLLTQTPIRSTCLVEFSQALSVLFDFDMDGCLVRKVITSLPDELRAYKPEVEGPFPGDFPIPRATDVAKYDLSRFKRPLRKRIMTVSVPDIAEKLDYLIKDWFKNGCRGETASLLSLGVDFVPGSIDDFAEMIKELAAHYKTSAVRIFPGEDPVKVYERYVAAWVEPLNHWPDHGNASLAKFILDCKILRELEARRAAAMSTFASCRLEPASKEVDEMDKTMDLELPVHVDKLLQEWDLDDSGAGYEWTVFGGAAVAKDATPTQSELFSQVISQRTAIPTLSVSQPPASPAVSRIRDAHRRDSLRSRRDSQGPSTPKKKKKQGFM